VIMARSRGGNEFENFVHRCLRSPHSKELKRHRDMRSAGRDQEL
jgi:hypothetical protein